jgi:UDP-N-acetylglucosamine acyltransferase
VHPGTIHGDLTTRVGSHCFILAGAHIAHDCQLGDHVTLINSATLGGHVSIGHHAMLGGLSAVHQFVRIGPHAFVGGMTGVADDVIPFGLVLGNRAALSGLNIVGLRRAGFSREEIHELRKAYRMLFSVEGTLLERIEDVEKMFTGNETVQSILEFIRTPADRPLCMPRNGTASV